jgi:hypothetical protein
MQCPDCKGSREYVPLVGPAEPCRLCNGKGELNDDGTPIDDKAKALDSVFNANLPDWMEDYKDQLDLINNHSGSLKTLEGLGRDVLPLGIGDTIYVFDADWYEAEIVHFGSYQGMDIVRADYICGRFFINVHDICWNDTQKRWEHIKSGTPLWP